MSNVIQIDEPPFVVRFLDRFLQEKNIRWLLVLGASILIASSFMLVARYWEDGFFSAPIKVLVMLGYTLLIEQSGWWMQKRLGLFKSGKTLLALTVALIPLVFFAIQWVYAAAGGKDVQSIIVYIALLISATAYASRAAKRIFDHFLFSTPPSFLFGYLVLCASGALLRLIPESFGAAAITGLMLWLTFFIGATKICRHTFWLVESRHDPRIFGFFPIALLGTQFLSLFSFFLGTLIEWEWIGFGMVLTAFPILVTADSVAQVFQQRTGNLVRPIPWSIVAPIVLGLLMCVGGAALTFIGFVAGHSLLAITPAALLAAILFGLVARRTQHFGFVWSLLFFGTIAYQFLPAFFQQVALDVLANSASAIHEERLPYAFYGITYLPLIALTTGIAFWLGNTGERLFSLPLRQFSSALSLSLLALALTNAKATFPVALLMTSLFAVQTRAFRMPILARAGIAAWLIALFGFSSFVPAMDFKISDTTGLAIRALGILALLWPGSRIDRFLSGFNHKQQQDCRIASLGASTWSAIMVIAWLFNTQDGTNSEVAAIAIPIFLMFVQSLYWCHTVVSLVTMGLLYLSGICVAAKTGFTGLDIALATFEFLLLQWFCGLALAHFPVSRMARAFGQANRIFTKSLLTIASIALLIPQNGLVILDVFPAQTEWLLVSIASAAWSIDTARRSRSESYLYLGVALVFLSASSALDSEHLNRVLLLWVCMTLAAAIILQRVKRAVVNAQWIFLGEGLERMFVRLLQAGRFPGLFVFDVPTLAAGALATVALLTLYRTYRNIDTTKTWMFANWQILIAVLVLASPFRVSHLFELFFVLQSALDRGIWAIGMLVAALSVIVWQFQAYYRGPYAACAYHRLMLRIVSLIGLLVVIASVFPQPIRIHVLTLATFVAWIASEVHAAYYYQDESRVWVAQAMLAVLGYTCHLHFDVGGKFGLIVLFLVGIGQSVLAIQSRKHSTLACFVGPLSLGGGLLTPIVVILGLFKPVAALNTLAMLGVAAFYFYQGRNDHQCTRITLAGLIANVVLFKWALSLSLTDPQIYMIPAGATIIALTRILATEIDRKWHNPLYYAGALTILTAPVLAIIEEESWLPMFSLLTGSLIVILIAIGLRVRALIYTGSAFLGADLLAMIIRSTWDNPDYRPLIGVALGLFVLGLAAWSERHRENLLQRMRILSAQLQQWA